jgi:hypothetical protein
MFKGQSHSLHEAALNQMRAQQVGVEELNAGCNVLDAAELDVGQAGAELATASWERDTYVSMVNQLDGFMVNVTESAGAALCIICAQYCHCVGASAVRR